MNKIFDYMLSGKPIICGINSKNNPIDLANCGIIVSADDCISAAQAVDKIKNMPINERENMGKNGFNYVCENHDYKKLSLKYIKELGKI